MKKYIKASSNSKLLAVFWYIEGKFYGPCDTLDSEGVENYGGVLQLPVDHFSVWREYNPKSADLEYDAFPRGRVMYNTKIRKFVVITSEALSKDPEFQTAVRREYGLPITTIFDSDEHYNM